MTLRQIVLSSRFRPECQVDFDSASCGLRKKRREFASIIAYYQAILERMALDVNS